LLESADTSTAAGGVFVLPAIRPRFRDATAGQLLDFLASDGGGGDSGLQMVISRWSDVPDPLKAGILARWSFRLQAFRCRAQFGGAKAHWPAA